MGILEDYKSKILKSESSKKLSITIVEPKTKLVNSFYEFGAPISSCTWFYKDHQMFMFDGFTPTVASKLDLNPYKHPHGTISDNGNTLKVLFDEEDSSFAPFKDSLMFLYARGMIKDTTDLYFYKANVPIIFSDYLNGLPKHKVEVGQDIGLSDTNE